MNELDKLRKLIANAFLTREAVSKAFGITKNYSYQLTAEAVKLTNKNKELINKLNRLVVDKETNTIIFIPNEKLKVPIDLDKFKNDIIKLFINNN